MVGELLGGDKGKLLSRESKVNSCAKGTEHDVLFQRRRSFSKRCEEKQADN